MLEVFTAETVKSALREVWRLLLCNAGLRKSQMLEGDIG